MDILHIVLGCSGPWYSNAPLITGMFGRTAAFTFQQDLNAFTHWNPLQGLVDAGGLIMVDRPSHMLKYIIELPPNQFVQVIQPLSIRHELSLSSYFCLSLAIIMEPTQVPPVFSHLMRT